MVMKTLARGIPVLLFFLVILVLASLVSIMITFMGGDHAGADGQMLLGLQSTGSAFSLVVSGLALYVFSLQGSDGLLQRLWEHTPGWQLFSFLLLNMLAIFGAATYWMIAAEMDWLDDPINFTSLISLSTASLAYLVLSALGHYLAGHPPYSKARW